ncbi:hypothetical protein BwSH20_49120 [Bradyrhizobium ottawaense]|nr:hypothetical protein SG09_71850 [Bradyrhizobium ottawaense]GMO42670.1 hypothetical protein BwSF21_55230 [Bradyrhizobium ottawaense]GMO46343.1 hypothetical protein BwSH14_62950 [Bradyrhizobium ottawaense]GMO52999.1 hypothetical protein BwSF12_64290 [Bradyrhizobium ottawaense]GMO75963.1 hypothetical protein BwSF19_20680 [Bradyrhizobium ottawaense]
MTLAEMRDGASNQRKLAQSGTDLRVERAPDAAQQRKNAAARPGHERGSRRGHMGAMTR